MLEKILEAFVGYLPNILYSLVIFAVGFVLIKLVLKILRAAFMRTKLETTGWEFLLSVINCALYVILGVMVLSQLKVPMSSIVAALGTAGLAIGLALRDSLSNVAGGFILMFSRPFKVGDYIEVAGKEGSVCAITILSTKLLTVDNKAVIIPNSIITSKTITNFTQEELRQLEMRFNIACSDDCRAAQQTLSDTVSANSLSLDKPQPPYIRISKQGAGYVELLLRVWVRTEDYWELYYSLISDIKDAFEGEDISFANEQLEVHITNCN